MSSVAERAIRGAIQSVPNWQNIDTKQLFVKTITGGLTNHLTLVGLKELEEENNNKTLAHEKDTCKALVRIFGEGTDEFIDRGVEGVVCRLLASTGVAPRVYGVFQGGRAEEFIDNAKSVYNVDLHKPEILNQVGKLMARMHGIDLHKQVDKETEACYFDKPTTPVMLRTLFEGACTSSFALDTRKALKLAALQVGSLSQEIDWLENELVESKMPKVLCHRDLQSGNVMVQNQNGESKVYLIDFEYSGLDFCAFDYGNTFCEMAINNFCPKFPGFVLDPSLYPTTEQKRAFFSSYLEALDKPSREMFGGDNDRECVIDKLIDYSKLGMLASHLQWGLWGIVQSQHSSLDFGYLEYATARLDQYYYQRQEYEHNKRIGELK